ncbi:hypothetical protein AN963_29715 [Brevibacillus choshinensis]|uniref:Uncharacterized protein n=1 Tax=Brevibacillus choshinensis TaxID=54911 RepID=A0ABR5MZT0_BRECH|nr:hypothetical protein AN963_29715 [Brevibacillus choshinensis]
MLNYKVLKILLVLLLTAIIYKLVDSIAIKGVVDFVDSIAWLLSLIASTQIVRLLSNDRD